MAVYAIGDIQGCFSQLQRLLEHIRFDPESDRLWFTGDLVNRGPQSLEVLRFVKGLGERAVTVLGNHDLHLIAIAHGFTSPRPKDTLDALLQAPDRDELIDWLITRPLLHLDRQLDYLMIHAGLPPQWDVDEALARAREVEEVLRGRQRVGDYLAQMYGDEPAQWSPELGGMNRLRFITNCFTRMRFCDSQGRLDLQHKGPPGSEPGHLMPWYLAPGRRSRQQRIVFGHWSTHGQSHCENVYALDTGCLWGGTLTAMRLDGEPAYAAVDCPAARAPDGY